MAQSVTAMPLGRSVLAELARSSAEAIVVADAQTADPRVIFVNRAYELLTGCAAADLMGRSWKHIVAGPDRSVLSAFGRALARGEWREGEVTSLRSDGSRWRCVMRSGIFCDAEDAQRYLICQLRPISESALPDPADEASQESATLRIEPMARIDVVTGLLKRDVFLELADRDFGMARRSARTLAVLLFDVSELGVYRETFGAKAANSCLRMVAAQVLGMLRRAGDLCARYGDSTLVALVHDQNVEQARGLARRIAENVCRLALHNPRSRSGRYISAEAAVVAGVPSQGDTLDSMIERAQAQLSRRVAVADEQRA
jgi:diguanylate cyclase (GGDEF)-like protein/PAS domain S-box-containing protein